MPKPYDAKKTQEYFDSLAKDYSVAYAPREDIFLEVILPKYKAQHQDEITALDFGCGGGALVLKLLNRGINAQGVEKHDNLCKIARVRLAKAGFERKNIIQGSIKELDNFKPGFYDFVILMGVFQYLPPKDRDLLLKKIHKLLKPNGHLVATFQNAFFDLFTFNRYTLDFFDEKLFKPLGLDKLLGKKLMKDVSGLLTNPDKPNFSSSTARDNIYVETTNPLTIGEELKKYRFMLLQKYFYSYFFVPRLVEGKYKAKLKKLENRFDLIRKMPTQWYGHFMANAFLVDCIKENEK